MEYLIKTIRDGNNQVNVLKKLVENTYSLEWTFPLKKDSEPIILSEMFNKDCFVIANWNAWIRIYSISKKELLFEKIYNGSLNSKAKVSIDKTKLYIAYETKDDYKSFIEVISLIDFSILTVIELPERFKIGHFTLGTTNKLLFYYLNKDFSDNTWEHGYNVINEQSKTLTNFKMDYAQWDKFETKAPVISTKHNLGIMPLWHDIEIEKDKEGNQLFVFKIMLFELTNFKVIKTIAVRTFPTQQLGYYEQTSEELAKKFRLDDKQDEDYKEAIYSFIDENLNSIFFDNHNNSFWLCFRGGIVRNVTFDGKLSPLFVTISMAGSSAKGAFNFPGFHSEIDLIESNTIVLKEHNDSYLMNFTENEILSDKAIIEKEIIKKESIKIISSEKDKRAIEEANIVVINVPDLKNKKSYLNALDEIIQLTKNIDDIKSGHLLRFRIKDKEIFEEDEVFFEKAIKVEGAAEKIAQIISNFTKYKHAGRLYADQETTSLAHAMYNLAASNAKYIEKAIEYLSVIDYEHDVFNGNLIYLLREKYHAEFGKQIIKGLSKLIDGELWLEIYEEAS